MASKSVGAYEKQSAKTEIPGRLVRRIHEGLTPNGEGCAALCSAQQASVSAKTI